MYLEELLSWIQNLSPAFAKYIAGSPIKEHEDILGVYILSREVAGKTSAIGITSTYSKCGVRLKVRCLEACSAQKKAMVLYRDIEKDKTNLIAGRHIQAICMLYDEPQPDRLDEQGLTYIIDLEITYER